MITTVDGLMESCQYELNIRVIYSSTSRRPHLLSMYRKDKAEFPPSTPVILFERNQSEAYVQE